MLTRDERGAALVGGLPLAEILASDAVSEGEGGSAARVPTPVYVYALDAIEGEARALSAAFGGAPHLIAYAIKADAAGPIVRTLAAAGCGVEVVSGGELTVALACGVPPDHL